MFKNITGFSLIELMIGFGMLSVVSMMGVQLFVHLQEQHQRTIQLVALHQDILSAQQLARSHHQSVVLCGSHDGRQCQSNDWSQGRLLYLAHWHGQAIQRHRFFFHKLHLKQARWLWRSALGKNDRLIFSAQGDNLSQRGSFYYCLEAKKQVLIWRLVINQAGRVYSQQTTYHQQC